MQQINEARRERGLGPIFYDFPDINGGPVSVMQFVDPEYTTPLNRDCLENAEYRQDMRWSMEGGFMSQYRTSSHPPCYESVRTLTETHDTWLDVSFWFAWLANAFFIGVGCIITFALLSAVLHNDVRLAVFVMLVLLPLLSLVYTIITRKRHYGYYC